MAKGINGSVFIGSSDSPDFDVNLRIGCTPEQFPAKDRSSRSGLSRSGSTKIAGSSSRHPHRETSPISAPLRVISRSTSLISCSADKPPKVLSPNSPSAWPENTILVLLFTSWVNLPWRLIFSHPRPPSEYVPDLSGRVRCHPARHRRTGQG